MKGRFFLYFVILLSIIIICSMLFINDVVYNIRMLELKMFLREVNRTNSNVDYLGLVAKYKLHKALYENKINYPDFDKEQLKVSALISNFQNQNEIVMHKYSKASIPVFYILNFLRFFLNKPPLQQLLNNPIDEELVIAYYYERNYDYNNALSLYERLMSKYNKYKVANDKRLIVILHEGFCYSIIGEYNKARDKYLYIIKNYNNENIALTAAILLRYIENFQEEIKKIKASDMSEVEKSENLYKIIAFKDALEILNKIQSNDKKEDVKINYLKARCLEETNKKLDSIKIYQQIITEKSETEYAKYANLRLLTMSSTMENGESLKKLSINNNEIINDPVFNEVLEDSNKIKELKIKRDNVFSKINMSGFIEKSLKAVEEIKINKRKNEKKVKKEKKPINKTRPIKTIDKSKLIETIIYEDNNKKGPYTKEYKDKDGTIYRSELYDENEKLLNYYIYEYDENGDSVGVLGFDADGNQLKF